MTDEILKAMQIRDQLARSNQRTNWKIWKNRVNHLIKDAKKEYYINILESNKSNLQNFWKFFKEIIPSKSKTNNTTKTIHGLSIDNESQAIAEIFCEHFSNISKDYLDVNNTHQEIDDHQNVYNMTLSTSNPFVIPPISKDFVLKQLTSLQLKKSTGLDNISSKILRIAAPIIAGHLTRIINTSITECNFPSVWKTAKIIPIYKKGDPTKLTNYRPISILSTLSKILERHVANSLYTYINKTNLLHTNQSGFRAGHSCETALLKITQDWYTSLNNKEVTGVVFLDFSKAFDLVNHNLLLEKLSMYNFSSEAIAWFCNYLNDRKSSVFFNSCLSMKREFSSGVPQGSILGPILFLIFINDLLLVPTTSTINLYTDDSVIYSPNNSVESVNERLNQDLSNIASWCARNQMVINHDKSKSMLISTAQNLRHQSQKSLSVYIRSKKLENVDKQKILGVTVDNKIYWSPHISCIVKKISTYIKVLYRIKNLLPIFSRKTYYNSFISSHMNYCSTVWSGASSNQIERLFILQKRIARVILDKEPREPHEILFTQLQWHPIHSWVNLRRCMMVYRCINRQVPDYLQNMFYKASETRARTTRSSSHNLVLIFSQNRNI